MPEKWGDLIVGCVGQSNSGKQFWTCAIECWRFMKYVCELKKYRCPKIGGTSSWVLWARSFGLVLLSVDIL